MDSGSAAVGTGDKSVLERRVSSEGIVGSSSSSGAGVNWIASSSSRAALCGRSQPEHDVHDGP